jgi:hypothetical protein
MSCQSPDHPMTPVFTGPLAVPVIVHDPAGSDKFFMHANAAQKPTAIAKPPAFWQQPALPDLKGLSLSIRLTATPDAYGTLSIRLCARFKPRSGRK